MKRLALLVALAFAGCNFATWHRLDNTGQNQVLRAASGDRYFLTLATAEGERWTATCDDPDVDVRVDPHGNETKVELRVHRGYDGPSAVKFACRRNGETVRRFTISLYRETGDRSFWE